MLTTAPKIVRLTPPLISPSTVMQKTVCTRPVREGGFNISYQQSKDKIVINCYGHGGSGWTTLFGSVYKAIGLYTQLQLNKNTPIIVIGGGCMGLTMAVELTRLGYSATAIYTKSLYNLPSWNAGGYFSLVSLKTSLAEQENVNNLALETFFVYRQIERGEHPYITRKAVDYLPVYCSKETESGVEALEAQGLIPAREDVTLDFGNGTVHHNYVKYMTYFMNTTTLMKQLHEEVEKLNIKVKERELKSLDEVAERVVFNCAGLFGSEFVADPNMIPVRGHIIALNEAAGNAHMDYMIYTKVKQAGQDERVYLFPKNLMISDNHFELASRGVLGGTFLPDRDNCHPSEQESIDQREFKKMLERACLFFHKHLFVLLFHVFFCFI